MPTDFNFEGTVGPIHICSRNICESTSIRAECNTERCEGSQVPGVCPCPMTVHGSAALQLLPVLQTFPTTTSLAASLFLLKDIIALAPKY